MQRRHTSVQVARLKPRRQKGVALLELALALIISTMLLASQFSQIMAAVDQNNATATGEYLQKLQAGINKYVDANIASLKANTPITGFSTPLQPTVAQLITGGYLPAGFSTVSPLGLSFNNVMTRTGSCPSGSDCVISGYSYATAAYTDAGGQLRSDVLGYAIQKMGSDGAMSFAATPGQLTFQGGGTVTNPAGSTAGILAIRIGTGSGLLLLLNQYYKLDGTNPLAGTLNANNNDITNVKNITSTGQTQLATVTISGDVTLTGTGTPGSACATDKSVQRNSNGTGLVVCSGGVWQMIGNVIAGIGDGVGCSTSGQIGTTSTGTAYVCTGTVWTSLNNNAAPGGSCAPDGKTATSTTTKEQLVCKNGVYIKLVSLLNKSVEISRSLVADGTVAPKPSCEAGGTPAYSFHLTQTVVDVSVAPPRQAMYITATDNGSSWTVKIKVKDNFGAEVSANVYSISAVMKLECSY